MKVIGLLLLLCYSIRADTSLINQATAPTPTPTTTLTATTTQTITPSSYETPTILPSPTPTLGSSPSLTPTKTPTITPIPPLTIGASLTPTGTPTFTNTPTPIQAGMMFVWKNLTTGESLLPFNYVRIFGQNLEIESYPPYLAENSILRKNNTYELTFEGYLISSTVFFDINTNINTGFKFLFNSLTGNPPALINIDLFNTAAETNLLLANLGADTESYIELSFTNLLWTNMRGLATFTPQDQDVRISELYLFHQQGTTLRETTLLAVAPEPSALSLLGFGLGGLAMMRRRRS